MLVALYSNQNYQAIKATLDGAGAGAPYGPLIFFSRGAVVLLILLLIIGLVALRRKPGFWSLMLGVIVGVGASGIMRKVFQAIS
jgi:hypothetical protein